MADNIFGKKRNIDVVFCIDGTGSMAPCIESVKANAKRFHEEFVSQMTMSGSEIDSMRARVIVFRDFECDGEGALEASPFFELPMDEAEFANCLAGVSASGGGDYAENGLEALYTAMCSDFTTGSNDRQVIALFTDADALELQDPSRKSAANYPADMVKDEDELLTAWMCMSQSSTYKLRERNKRLVIFAPEGSKYKTLAEKFNRSVFDPVDMSKGLGEIDFADIIKILVASASNA